MYKPSRSIPLDTAEYIDKPTIATDMGRKAAGLPPRRAGQAGFMGALTRLPANFVPPPTAIDFNASNSQSVGPGPTSVVISTFRIPRGSVGVVRSLTFQINNMLVTDVITFAFLVNEAPAPGWTYNVFPRAAGNVVVSFGPEETFIKIPDGALCGFQVSRTDGGTNLMGGLFHGWHFSKSVAMAYGLSGI